jgi:hypothetical protein
MMSIERSASLPKSLPCCRLVRAETAIDLKYCFLGAVRIHFDYRFEKGDAGFA